MALEKARAYLAAKGLDSHIIIPEHSSATVAEAAAALGCEPGMIAKTLSFLQESRTASLSGRSAYRPMPRPWYACPMPGSRPASKARVPSIAAPMPETTFGKLDQVIINSL